jgi:hypothetical protein
MEEKFDRKQVEISFRKFNDYAVYLLSSSYNLFNTRFNIFLNHCETDEVMSVICNQLKNTDVNVDEWYEKGRSTGGSFVGSCQFDLPVDETERDALLYKLCIKVNKREIDLFGFCIEFFGDGNFDAMVEEFKEAIVRPMVDSIGYKLEEITYEAEIELEKDDRYIPVNIFYVYQNYSTNVNGDINTKGDAAIGEGASIEKKSSII